MAWVLKMDEVIESGLVHDFDASLTGIGQELGAGAYSMRYRTGRPGPDGRTGGRTPPYPWGRLAGPWAFSRRGCDQRCPGSAAWPPGPCSLAGLCPPRWRAWAPEWLRVSFLLYIIFSAVKHARL